MFLMYPLKYLFYFSSDFIIRNIFEMFWIVRYKKCIYLPFDHLMGQFTFLLKKKLILNYIIQSMFCRFRIIYSEIHLFICCPKLGITSPHFSPSTPNPSQKHHHMSKHDSYCHNPSISRLHSHNFCLSKDNVTQTFLIQFLSIFVSIISPNLY